MFSQLPTIYSTAAMHVLLRYPWYGMKMRIISVAGSRKATNDKRFGDAIV